MGKIKLHWWIMLGIMVGVSTGTLINQAYLDEARETVLGSGYSEATPQQLQEHAQDINEELRRRVLANPVGAGIEGLSRIFMSLLKMIVLPLVFRRPCECWMPTPFKWACREFGDSPRILGEFLGLSPNSL